VAIKPADEHQLAERVFIHELARLAQRVMVAVIEPDRPINLADLPDRAMDSRIVDHDIETAKCGNRGVEHSIDVGGPGYVAGVRDDFTIGKLGFKRRRGSRNVGPRTVKLALHRGQGGFGGRRSHGDHDIRAPPCSRRKHSATG
jgi:hypothetical protein